MVLSLCDFDESFSNFFFPGELRRSVHTSNLGPTETANSARVQTFSARLAIGQHQYLGRTNILHTEFTLRRFWSGRVFFCWKRFRTVSVRRQSSQRGRKVRITKHNIVIYNDNIRNRKHQRYSKMYRAFHAINNNNNILK